MKIKGIEKYMRIDHYDFASIKPVVNTNDLVYKFAAEVIDMQNEKIVEAIRDAKASRDFRACIDRQRFYYKGDST